MLPENKNEKQNGETMPFTTSDTEKKYCVNECKDIKKRWKWNCPDCGKPKFFQYKSRLIHASEINRRCHSCARTYRYKLLREKDLRKEMRNGKWWFYRICPNCGEKVFYKEVSHRNHMEKRGEQCRKCFRMDCFLYPKFNKKACEFFFTLNRLRGWKGRHALDGGEYYIPRFHYFLDYYEPTLNLVLEWDEPHHKYQQTKDAQRRKNIKKALGCRLIVINERTKIEDIIF